MTESAAVPKLDNLHDTYLAALQHGHVEPSDDALVLGVVQKPMYGLQSVVYQNWTSLAPREQTLRRLKHWADEIGHNEAWERVDFEERYRAHLQNPSQQRGIHHVLSELENREVWLVCYENTDEKRCHREILREEIERVASDNDSRDES